MKPPSSDSESGFTVAINITLMESKKETGKPLHKGKQTTP